MPFYSDLAAMAADLLQPDSAGGLGQGAIQIVRVTPGTVDPLHPEVPVSPVRVLETVNQIGKPKAEYRDGETVIKTDMAYMITPVSTFIIAPGDLVRIGSVDVGTIVHVERLGSLETTVYELIWANR